MTYEEARNLAEAILEAQPKHKGFSDFELMMNDFYKTVIECIEKQIPKKPSGVMQIKVITMSGDESIYQVKSFEMRANQVTNWVKLTLMSDNILTIHRVATLKMNEVEDEERSCNL